MLRVLVVDDFPDTASMTQSLLELRGHECRIALTGAEALAVATTFDPDVALLDLALPDLSGFEIARTLRERSRGIYLAALTGWADPDTRARTLAAGFDDHVIKPADSAKLDLVMRKARDGRVLG